MSDKSESVEEVEETETAEEVVEETEAKEEKVEEEPKVEKPKETLEQKEARLARELKQTRKKLGKEDEEPKAPSKQNTGELDDTQLDYLDLKGVSEEEDIQIIEAVMKKTDKTLRQALKDDYVISKLEANKRAREVKNAVPSSSKRGGSTPAGLEAALAKYEATGKLPEDFDLRAKVVEAKYQRENSNKPAWR